MSNQHLMQALDLMAAWAVGPDGTLTYTRRGQDPEDECFVKLPVELAAYMRIVRILDANPTGKPDLAQVPGRVTVGTTIELDYYTMGVKLFIRHGKDGTLRVFAQTHEGMEKLADYEKE